MRKEFLTIYAALLTVAIFTGCNRQSSETTIASGPANNPEWSKDIVLYEVNVRQFTDEGTFSAILPHVDRLAELGVDVIWFMPIHPIGEVNRKGTLGSYYSVKNFREVNPEFGTMEEFRALVDAIHQAGMHVIIDWVPNHSSWDNPLATDHRDWYRYNEDGGFVSPYDWTDVIAFDWENEELWDYMQDALLFWVREAGIDGYRVDHPHVTPADFWLRARHEMEKVKPVLMLAENEDRVEFFDNGFDINYSWELHHIINGVAQGTKEVSELNSVLEKDLEQFPPYAYRMRFIDNHDENSWAGTINERLGEAHRAMAVYIYTIPGVPLMYNGQEAGLDKRLQFFERDPIEWKESGLTPFYTTLNNLKAENVALWNGTEGGSYNLLQTSGDEDICAYLREKDGNSVIAIINMSAEPATFTLDDTTVTGIYNDCFTDTAVTLSEGTTLQLGGWEYLLVNRLPLN